MSTLRTPKTCERCGHLLEYYEQLGRSFCPDCDREQIDELLAWREQAYEKKRQAKSKKPEA